MGQEADHEKIQRVLGQLNAKDATALRVENEIILFDEKKLTAVHEILKNRKVPKAKVKQFLESPTAFIDASLVDLDIGFSIRVHGVTRFKHAYFGETDGSNIDWFGASSSSSVPSILPISKLSTYIKEPDKLEAFKSKLADAVKVGADEVTFEKKTFDISDPVTIYDAINTLEQKIINQGGFSDEIDVDIVSPEPKPDKSDPLVVDIGLNDEAMDIASPILNKILMDVLYPSEELDWSNYLRQPYPHQEIGIRWVLGLALSEEEISGGLLADDMGLGKTYMALSAIEQLYTIYDQIEKVKKPCLIVAPLSVVQNWKDEVEKTFSSSPFSDIVVLQADADLPKYRLEGVTQTTIDDGTIAEIRFLLKVGGGFPLEALDQPQRLVITTYQTLRDYQFSLCTVDWGVVIFDEAQNIKNPNALQTRAAKGLKADFKLLATGTPVENSLADLWCLLDTVSEGSLSSYQDFRKKYVVPILQAAGDEIEEVRGRVGQELRLTVGALMLRRVKEDHIEGLPKKHIFVGIEEQGWEYMPELSSMMHDRQLDIYDATINAQKESESNVALGSLQRLRDVSLHPQLADGGQLKIPHGNRAFESLINESGKMQSLISILDEIRKRGEKGIIFIVNKRLQIFLSIALGQRYSLGSLSVVNGDTKAVSKKSSTPTRKSIINDFEARDGFNIIIMSPVAAGVGLTIIGANNVVHLERHWNPAKEAQATDRVYRIGQKKEVNVFVPILHHPVYESFDVNLHRLLSKKTLLKDAVVTPEQVVPNPGGFGNSVIDSFHIITAEDLHRLSWQQFEALCAELFAKEYGVTSCWLTQTGSDFGADVVLASEGVAKIIQCKHTKGSRYDGYKAIQEIHSAKVKYSAELGKNIDMLIFVTNAKILSAKTKVIASQYGVKIFSYTDIALLLPRHSITFEMVLKRLGKNRLKVK